MLETRETRDLDMAAFDAAETVIEQGQATFLAVGQALWAIRELGRAERERRGYPTFEDYMQRRWGWSRRRGYQVMAASEVARTLDVHHLLDVNHGFTAPVNERQLRPLTALEPEDQRAAWAAGVRLAPDGRPRVGDLQRTVREIQAARRAERAEAPASERPEPPVVLPVRLEVADARSLPLPGGSVDLIVTSPPYGLDVTYEDGDVEPGSWFAWLDAPLREAYRVARAGGRLALNVPLDTTRGGFRPTYGESVWAAVSAGWTYRATIVWNEGNVTRPCARGTVDSPASPHVIAPVEMIGLFSRDVWSRQSDRQPDISHEEWLAWTNGLWTFPGESRGWEGHPATFPEELPRRLIRLLSWPGDVVLDPFCGSGTTVLVAHRLGRQAVGFDRSPESVASARRRIGAALS